VPVVLRKSETVVYDHRSDHAFEVIGESYIHGKMDGEAVQDKQLVSQHKRRFLLK
jgi:hypothetical protein